MFNDDIAAVTTPPGEGGIAIIRASGNQVIEKIDSIFKSFRPGISLKEKKGYTLTLGWIIDENNEIADEVLIGIMKTPHSYTAEDVVEINCHGGSLPARRCLEIVLSTGVRLAQPGEFTRRAFLNGRLDVCQAEAVIDVIRSKTDKSLKLAMNQVTGENSKYIYLLEDKLIRINAMVEASLDFPDDVGDLDYDEAKEILDQSLNIINQLLKAGKRAEVYREGINVAICGKPNVGKSSLLNILIKKDKAIVTSIPGTTRDVVEEYINIRGIPVKIMDTAGIRNTEDIVENIGIEKSKEVIKKADLVIFILDIERGINKEDLAIYDNIENQNIIVLVNKDDLEEKNISEKELKDLFKGIKVVKGSVKENVGIEELETSIEEKVFSGEVDSDDIEIMINLRHKNALIDAKKYLTSAINSIDRVPLDCMGVDILGALESVGEITGKNLKEEVIDRIFKDFCIGK
jgi:tRNA modification GTPase